MKWFELFMFMKWLFMKWFEHFVNHVGASPQRRCLLIMDNNSSHVNMDLVCEARRNGVDIITLPLHTSHILQPLDVSVYGPLKKAWNRQVQYHHDTHPGERIGDGDIGALFGRAYDTAVRAGHNNISGFKATGIHPYNPYSVMCNDDVFVHTILTADDEPGETEDVESLLHDGRDPNAQSSTSDAFLRGPGPDVSQDGAASVVSAPDASQEGAAPVGPALDASQEGAASVGPAPDASLEGAAPVGPAPEASLQDAAQDDSMDGPAPDASLHDLLPVPQVNRKKAASNSRKRLSSVVLTSSPVKKMLKERKKNLKTPKEKQQNSAKNKTKKASKTTDTADSDICMYCQEGVTRRNEVWLRCSSCSGWAHEMCSNGSSSKGFICDLNCQK